MGWEPLSREALDEIIAAGLATCDDAVRAEWDRIKVPPEKWRCSPEGDRGGGFWVVAEDRCQVLWYNDIEEGFNYSSFSECGVIGEYRCEQAEFTHILERIAQRHHETRWRQLQPGDIPDRLRGPGTIQYRHTTYWDLRSSSGALYRVHFQDKAEHAFATSTYRDIQLTSEHPLLVEHHDERASVFIASPARDPHAAVTKLASAIKSRATAGARLRLVTSPPNKGCSQAATGC